MATTKKTASTKKRVTRTTPVSASSEPVMHDAPVVVTQPQNQTNKFLVVLVVALILFCGYLFKEVSSLKANPAATGQAQQAAPESIDDKVVKSFLTDDRIVVGDKNSKNIILEISDTSCPFCHVASGKNPELVAQMGEQFKTVAEGGSYTPPVPEIKKLVDAGEAVYVHMFGSGHGNGFLAAEALYCANDQDQFWQAHDKLMTNAGYTLLNDQIKNDRTQAATLAEFLAPEIDQAYMSECLSSKKFESRVTRDVSKNAELYFSGTPHYVVNGKIFGGAVDFNAMKAELK